MTNELVRGKRLRTGLVVGLSFIIGIFVFVAVLAVVKHYTPGSNRGILPVAERTVAALNMPTLEGGSWSLFQTAGQVVVVNNFATWCGPCREEMPELKAIGAEYQKKGVVFVLVSFDRDEQLGRPFMRVLREYVEQAKIDFTVLVPPRDSALFVQASPVPQTFLIDKHGRVAESILGQIDGRDLRASLDKLVAEE